MRRRAGVDLPSEHRPGARARSRILKQQRRNPGQVRPENPASSPHAGSAPPSRCLASEVPLRPKVGACGWQAGSGTVTGSRWFRRPRRRSRRAGRRAGKVRAALGTPGGRVGVGVDIRPGPGRDEERRDGGVHERSAPRCPRQARRGGDATKPARGGTPRTCATHQGDAAEPGTGQVRTRITVWGAANIRSTTKSSGTAARGDHISEQPGARQPGIETLPRRAQQGAHQQAQGYPAPEAASGSPPAAAGRATWALREAARGANAPKSSRRADEPAYELPGRDAAARNWRTPGRVRITGRIAVHVETTARRPREGVRDQLVQPGHPR